MLNGIDLREKKISIEDTSSTRTWRSEEQQWSKRTKHFVNRFNSSNSVSLMYFVEQYHLIKLSFSTGLFATGKTRFKSSTKNFRTI